MICINAYRTLRVLKECFAETKLERPELTHGYLKGRRREDCELVQEATGKRLCAAAHGSDLEGVHCVGRAVSGKW